MYNRIGIDPITRWTSEGEPMADPCPCGSEIKPGQAELAYITQAIIDNVKGTAGIPIVALLDPLYGRAIDLRQLCLEPPPRPPTSIAAWFENPIDFLDSILQAILSITWNLWCQCSDCPPVTGCGTGTPIFVDQSDAYCPVSAQVPEPDPCAPCQVYYYVLDDSATYYAERSDGHCYGPFTGVEIRWPCDSFAPPGYVTVANGDGSGAINWLTSAYGTSVTLWTGGSGGGAPGWVWEDDGTTVEDPPEPPTCDPTTICTAVDYIYQAVNAIRLTLDPGEQNIGRIGSVQSFHLPGVPDPITGNISQQLMQIAEYLAPMRPSQLINPSTAPVSGSTTIDVTDQAFVTIEMVTVPAHFGSRGTNAEMYFGNWRSPAPGWVLLQGAYGVISYQPLFFPNGLQILIPPMGTELAIELQPGVEVSVTTYQRALE